MSVRDPSLKNDGKDLTSFSYDLVVFEFTLHLVIHQVWIQSESLIQRQLHAIQVCAAKESLHPLFHGLLWSTPHQLEPAYQFHRLYTP